MFSNVVHCGFTVAQEKLFEFERNLKPKNQEGKTDQVAANNGAFSKGNSITNPPPSNNYLNRLASLPVVIIDVVLQCSTHIFTTIESAVFTIFNLGSIFYYIYRNDNQKTLNALRAVVYNFEWTLLYAGFALVDTIEAIVFAPAQLLLTFANPAHAQSLRDVLDHNTFPDKTPKGSTPQTVETIQKQLCEAQNSLATTYPITLFTLFPISLAVCTLSVIKPFASSVTYLARGARSLEQLAVAVVMLPIYLVSQIALTLYDPQNTVIARDAMQEMHGGDREFSLYESFQADGKKKHIITVSVYSETVKDKQKEIQEDIYHLDGTLVS